MKATGIVRQIDDLGRVVIPIELRRTLRIKEGDPLEIFVDGDRVVLKKYAPGCIHCGNTKNIEVVMDDNKLICSECVTKIRTATNVRKSG